MPRTASQRAAKKVKDFIMLGENAQVHDSAGRLLLATSLWCSSTAM